MKIKICNNCIVDSGFKEVDKVVAASQPIACDVCGNEFQSLILADNDRACTFDPTQPPYDTAPIGMFHCPECGEMVVAGMPHPDYSLLY